MSELDTAYEVLELESGEDYKRVKAAYLRLSLQCKPDRFSEDVESIRKCNMIREAYKIVSRQHSLDNEENLEDNNKDSTLWPLCNDTFEINLELGKSNIFNLSDCKNMNVTIVTKHDVIYLKNQILQLEVGKKAFLGENTTNGFMICEDSKILSDNMDINYHVIRKNCTFEGNISYNFNPADEVQFNILRDNGMNLLHWAVSNNLKYVALYALENGANIESYDFWDNTALQIAIDSGFIDMAQFLLEHNASFSNIDIKKSLLNALHREDENVISLLIDSSFLWEDEF